MNKQDASYFFLGILFLLLMNFPLLEIFNNDSPIGGIPLLFFYLFGVWMAAIVALCIWARNLAFPKGKEPE